MITYFKFNGNCHAGEIQYDTGIFSATIGYNDVQKPDHYDNVNKKWLKDDLNYWILYGFLRIPSNVMAIKSYEDRLGNYEDFSYEDWCWYWNQCKRVVEKLKTLGEDIEEFEWKGHWNKESNEDLFKIEVEKLAKEYSITDYKLEV